MSHVQPRLGAALRRVRRPLIVAIATSALLGSLGTSSPAVAREAGGGIEPRYGHDAPWPSRATRARARRRRAGRRTSRSRDWHRRCRTTPGSRPPGGAGAASEGDAAGTVRVTVEAVDAATGRRALDAVGGTNAVTGGNLVEADVAPSRLDELAGADGVRLVREPRRPSTFVESEGVGTTTADAWQTAGYTGAGARWRSSTPASPATRASSAPSCRPRSRRTWVAAAAPLAIDHGTAVAEIVHDMAPEAALRLVCIDTDVEIINALDTLPADGGRRQHLARLDAARPR